MTPTPFRATCQYGHETDARAVGVGQICFERERERERDRGYARSAARSESRILSSFHAQVGRNTRGWGRCLLGAFFPPGFGISGQTPSENKCTIASTASFFSSKCVQQNEHDPNATGRQTIQHLTSATKALVPTVGRALELSWSFFGADTKGGVRAPSLGASALSFPSTIHHVGSVYFSRFPKCKAFHASAL
jgi:hypothetical protein